MAFAGFRHGHITSLYALAQQWPEVEVVAACEEHAETRDQLISTGKIAITHVDVGRMLDEIDCDALAIGDYFARRGSLVLEALTRGKHAIVDKPLCTRLSEVAEMERITRSSDLKVGSMLTMRDSPQIGAARQLVRAGRIGEVHAVSFGGQHPLKLSSRPGWYFEEGKHGGTITDIGIHAIDTLPWVTGLQFKTVNAARSWNAFAPEYPHFHDAAQMMLTMDNGCGVLGDVSYFAPDRLGYSLPQYWRTTFWGRDGLIELSSTVDTLTVIGAQDAQIQQLAPAPVAKGGYLRSFLDDIAGLQPQSGLDTAAVLQSIRTAIQIQEAADHGVREFQLS
jgi:predicted dehydrogenase